MINEIWQKIKDYEDFYEVSNLGNVKSLGRKEKIKNSFRVRKPRILKTNTSSSCLYPTVDLRNGNGKKLLLVHRLVANAFIPNPENKPEVNHIDGNKLNNCVENLEWVTRSENLKHAHKTGLKLTTRIIGKNHPMAKEVARLSKEGKVIETYPCAKDAAIAVGLYKSSISCAIHSGYKRDGNHWAYTQSLENQIIEANEKANIG